MKHVHPVHPVHPSAVFLWHSPLTTAHPKAKSRRAQLWHCTRASLIRKKSSETLHLFAGASTRHTRANRDLAACWPARCRSRKSQTRPPRAPLKRPRPSAKDSHSTPQTDHRVKRSVWRHAGGRPCHGATDGTTAKKSRSRRASSGCRRSLRSSCAPR